MKELSKPFGSSGTNLASNCLLGVPTSAVEPSTPWIRLGITHFLLEKVKKGVGLANLKNGMDHYQKRYGQLSISGTLENNNALCLENSTLPVAWMSAKSSGPWMPMSADWMIA